MCQKIKSKNWVRWWTPDKSVPSTFNNNKKKYSKVGDYKRKACPSLSRSAPFGSLVKKTSERLWALLVPITQWRSRRSRSLTPSSRWTVSSSAIWSFHSSDRSSFCFWDFLAVYAFELNLIWSWLIHSVNWQIRVIWIYKFVNKDLWDELSSLLYG